jgi:hypothetical protein
LEDKETTDIARGYFFMGMKEYQKNSHISAVFWAKATPTQSENKGTMVITRRIDDVIECAMLWNDGQMARTYFFNDKSSVLDLTRQTNGNFLAGTGPNLNINRNSCYWGKMSQIFTEPKAGWGKHSVGCERTPTYRFSSNKETGYLVLALKEKGEFSNKYSYIVNGQTLPTDIVDHQKKFFETLDDRKVIKGLILGKEPGNFFAERKKGSNLIWFYLSRFGKTLKEISVHDKGNVMNFNGRSMLFQNYTPNAFYLGNETGHEVEHSNHINIFYGLYDSSMLLWGGWLNYQDGRKGTIVFRKSPIPGSTADEISVLVREDVSPVGETNSYTVRDPNDRLGLQGDSIKITTVTQVFANPENLNPRSYIKFDGQIH